nr:L10-interacting MYB domain-containing protein-like [Tanacetum cinerariifolium]
MMRMLMEEKKEDDMGACIEKLDKIGWAAQDLMYDTSLLLFGQSADYRKLWLHLKPESCGNWVKSVGKEEASKAAIAKMYDEVQAGIKADELFVSKLQQEEREEYTIEERAKFLAETIAAQRKFQAAQRSAKIRSRPPTKSLSRNLMMTYLKNMGGYKHSQLKAKFDRMDLEELYNLVMQRKKVSTYKKTLERMLALRLIDECESEAVFDLLRFIQKQIDESGSHDGSKKDL